MCFVLSVLRAELWVAIPQLFVDAPKVEYLGSMYKLFSKAGGVKLAVAAFKLHVKVRS